MSLPGTNIIAAIVPTNGLDTYPTHYSIYGKGGLKSVLTLAQRDNIPLERREYGMSVYVEATGKWYTLKTGLTNDSWEEELDSFTANQLIEENTVLNLYKRGFNNTGNQIDAYKVVTFDNGFNSNIPNIKPIDSYNQPALGIVINNVSNASMIKFPNYGIYQLPNGIIDTTLTPLKSPIYTDNTGNITLSWTPIRIGFVLTQATNPYILLLVNPEIKKYREFSFSSTTYELIIHDFEYYANVIVMDSLGRDITSSVNLTYGTNKKSLTLETNIPITGKIVCS